MMLALRMGRTLEELCRSMSSAEFSLWLDAYFEDLWGEARDYVRAGIIASMIGNYAGMQREQGALPLKPSDFMPRLSGEPEPEPEQELDPMEFFSAVSQAMLSKGR